MYKILEDNAVKTLLEWKVVCTAHSLDVLSLLIPSQLQYFLSTDLHSAAVESESDVAGSYKEQFNILN